MNKITAVSLIALGYKPVSVIPPEADLSLNSAINPHDLGKIPGMKGNDGKWFGYSWQKHEPTSEDATSWDNSGANIGILAANTPAFDIDVDDEELAKQIEQEILRICGNAPIRKGRSPRSLLFYRSYEKFKKQKLEFTYQGKGGAVELLGDGQQFVVSGVHPQGMAYSVSNIIPHSELTCLTPQLKQDAFQAVSSIIENAGGTVTTLSEKTSTEAGNDLNELLLRKVDLTESEIRQTVSQLDPDMPYDDWLKVGQALHAQYSGGGFGLVIWRLWSMKGSKYKNGDCNNKWKTFELKPDGISFKSVIQMTKKDETQTADVAEFNEAYTTQSVSKTRTPRKPKSVADLMQKKFKPRQWVIDKLLPEGCYLLAAHPKMGKSWLALQLCMAVTSGSEMFGRKVMKGHALYLALEDDELRLQDRLRKLGIEGNGDVNSLTYATEWERDGYGGAEDLEGWLKENPDTKLIVIDTLEKFRMPRKRNVNGYGEDYSAFSNLKRLSQKYRVAIILVHHLKKGSARADDLLEGISGTMGLSAAADGALILDRKRGEHMAKLQFTGRDIAEEKALAITFNQDNCLWTCEGYADQVFIAESKQKILEAFQETKAPLKASDIQNSTELNASTVRGILANMAKEGVVMQPKRGLYVLPDPVIAAEQQSNKQTSLSEVHI